MNERRASSSAAAHGFTLVELLVVMLIIGLGIAIVALSVDDNRGQQLLTDARRFANAAAAVADGAVFDPQPWGAQIYRDGAAGEQRIGWRWLHFGDKGWQPQTPPDLEAGGEFGAGVEAVLIVDGEQQPIEALPAARSAPGLPSAKQKSETLKADAPKTAAQAEAMRLTQTTPDLWLAAGETVPFELQLRFEGGETVAIVRGDLLGRVSLEMPDAP